MKYKRRQQEINELYQERLELVMERILEIANEPQTEAPLCVFFRQSAEYLLLAYEIAQLAQNGEREILSGEKGKFYNDILFHERVGEAYNSCFGNPTYAVRVLGEDYGRFFCVMYDRLHSFTQELYEGCVQSLCIYAELFVEIYNLMEQEDVTPKRLQEHLYSFMHDYSEVFSEQSVSRLIDPDNDYEKEICCNADLSNTGYLYLYGLFIILYLLKVRKNIIREKFQQNYCICKKFITLILKV